MRLLGWYGGEEQLTSLKFAYCTVQPSIDRADDGNGAQKSRSRKELS